MVPHSVCHGGTDDNDAQAIARNEAPTAGAPVGGFSWNLVSMQGGIKLRACSVCKLSSLFALLLSLACFLGFRGQLVALTCIRLFHMHYVTHGTCIISFNLR